MTWESLRKQFESGAGLSPGLTRMKEDLDTARALVKAATEAFA